jgi:hypothetical protein
MRRMMGRLIGLTLVGMGVIAGCQNDDFASATPEASALQMELTGDTAAEGLTAASADWGASEQALSGSVPEYLRHTRDGIRALNAGVAAVLTPIAEAIAKSGPQQSVGDTRTWGPHDRGSATYLFTMKKIATRQFGWVLQAKPQGAPDASYATVMGGLFQAGDQPHRGRGAMGVDLDKLALVDASFHGNGQLLVGFAHVGGYKVLAYGLKNFSPDVNAYEPVDAVFSGWRGPDGGARVRLAVWANVDDSATDAKELVLLRARWLPGVGGRADGLVTSGDVPDGHVLVANSCWSRDLTDVDGFYAVRDCSVGAVGAMCPIIKTAGKLSNCARGLDDEELPPTAPSDPTQEPGSPEQPAIPASMPAM